MIHGPILIVDDEPLNLAVMREVLGGLYRLAFARSGEEALRAAVRHQPLLILLDVRMPDMDGYEVCRQLKADAQTAAIPVNFVSGCTDTLDETRGFEAGAVDYLVKPVSPPIVRARVRAHLSLVSLERLERSYHDAIYMLGEAGHYRDNDTGVHIWRMAAYAAALGAACGLDAVICRRLELAAPMHDTGKLGIPDAILRKPGPLDADEWVIMRTHPRIGHDILARSQAPVFQMAAQIALRHHEKWDGSGYPDGLCGTGIPETARIVAIADVFDALTMKRPYKEAWPAERALAELHKGAGRHFEPRLVTAFADILPRILEIKAQWDEREAAGHATDLPTLPADYAPAPPGNAADAHAAGSDTRPA